MRKLDPLLAAIVLIGAAMVLASFGPNLRTSGSRDQWNAWCHAATWSYLNTDDLGVPHYTMYDASELQDWHNGAPVLCDDGTRVDSKDGRKL